MCKSKYHQGIKNMKSFSTHWVQIVNSYVFLETLSLTIGDGTAVNTTIVCDEIKASVSSSAVVPELNASSIWPTVVSGDLPLPIPVVDIVYCSIRCDDGGIIGSATVGAAVATCPVWCWNVFESLWQSCWMAVDLELCQHNQASQKVVCRSPHLCSGLIIGAKERLTHYPHGGAGTASVS